MTSSNSSELTALRARVQNLTTEIEARVQKRQRRGRQLRIAGIVLIAISSISLSRLTYLTSRLDADAIAAIGRQEIEERLPAARASAQGYFAGEAPQIVHRTLRSALESLPELRRFALRSFDSRIEKANATFETHTKTLLTKLVFDAKRNIDAAYPGDSDRKKLERLVTQITEQFEETILQATSGLYPEYKAEMERITTYLKLLKSAPLTALNKTQRLHRKIIDTLLQILARQQVTQVATPPR